MKRSVKILLKTAAITVLFGFGGLVAQAGGWDNFKLRYFSLTQVLNNTEKAVEDAQQYFLMGVLEKMAFPEMCFCQS